MMISYSQNFEDIILERIFKDKDDGLYVDIGACHPVYDSVTQHFYLKGWSGINVEPQPILFTELQAARQRDINLNLCIGSQPGRQTLYITQNVGTSTLNPELAEQYRQSQNIDQEIIVELITLDQLWTQKVQGRHVDFMKIDVEGFEQEVLAGADFSLVSPSILIIEATRPNSSELCHQQWEMLILDHYTFFYFDGLNRFYFRKGFSIDREATSIPPNVFDQFKTYPQLLLEHANSTLALNNDAMNEQLQSCLSQLARTDTALGDASNASENLQKYLQAKDHALNDASSAYKSLQEVLNRKEADLARQQKHLQAKDHAFNDASSAYKALQESLTLTQQELASVCQQQAVSASSLNEATNEEVLNRKEADLARLQKHLQAKDQALNDASSAYKALQENLDLTQQELASVCRQQDANSLNEATNAYSALQEVLNRKEADLARQQKHLQEKTLVIQNTRLAYEALQKELQDKDMALAHAAQAYKELNDAFNTKSRELGELHARLSNPAQPKDQ